MICYFFCPLTNVGISLIILCTYCANKQTFNIALNRFDLCNLFKCFPIYLKLIF